MHKIDVKVELLHHTPLRIADIAIGTCWDKQKNECDIARIDRVANKFKHESTIEHLAYTFNITGVTRAVLQELSRHRLASYSVKSSRYTLQELKNEETFKKLSGFNDTDLLRASKYVQLTNDVDVDNAIISALENLRVLVAKGKSNDLIKTAIPEAYKTNIVFTINARVIKNFLALRTGKDAWYQIRTLAKAIYEVIPEDHRFLYRNEYKL